MRPCGPPSAAPIDHAAGGDGSMTTAFRSLAFLFALAGMTALGAESRPAVQLTLASAELAEGGALRVWVKAEGLPGQRVVLADGATLLAAGELNLRGEAELVV